MILYHGSTMEVSQPRILKSEIGRDFGFAFYTTDIQAQAERWARRRAMIESRRTNPPAKSNPARKPPTPANISKYRIIRSAFFTFFLQRAQKAENVIVDAPGWLRPRNCLWVGAVLQLRLENCF